MKYFGLIAIAAFLLLSGSSTRGQGTAKVGGNFAYHSGNLLKNPDASLPSVNPPWMPNTGNWTVQTGSVGGINSSDGSPWFLEAGGIFTNCSGPACYQTRTVTLVQTVDVSGYSQLIHTYSTYFEYGGDAFANGTASGSGLPNLYHSSTGYQASYTLEFLNSFGNPVGMDMSGPLLSQNFACLFGGLPEHNYGYRRTTTGIPAATRSIRLTAKIVDRLSACYNFSSTGTFWNGFDNLWLDFIYIGAQPYHDGFTRGSAPGHAEKVKLTPGRHSPNLKDDRQLY
jgi:hypothetical protein